MERRSDCNIDRRIAINCKAAILFSRPAKDVSAGATIKSLLVHVDNMLFSLTFLEATCWLRINLILVRAIHLFTLPFNMQNNMGQLTKLSHLHWQAADLLPGTL